MSGKRQHFIPRFLQRGFTSHRSGEDAFTWLFRKGAEPFNTNIKNVGVEGHFYNLDGNTALDDEITDFEGELGAFVGELCASDSVVVPDPNIAAGLIAHLEVRTRHIRQNFRDAGQLIADQMLQFFVDNDAASRYFQKKFQNDPSIIRNALIEEFRARGASEDQLPHLLALAAPLEKQAMAAAVPQTAKLVELMRAELPEMIRRASKSGHIKAMLGAISPGVKVEVYQKLYFESVLTGSLQLPLGDSLVVFEVEGDRRYKPFFEIDDSLLAVYLPLETNRILVGRRITHTPNLPELSSAIAQCSLEFFIAKEQNAEIAKLHGQIGASAFLLSQDQIDELIGESLDVRE